MAPTGDPEIPDPLAMTRDAFVRAAARDGAGSGRAKDIYRAVHREGRADASGVAIPPIVRRHEEDTDEGTTIKFVQRLATPAGRVGDLETESVIIPMVGRTGARTHTLCVSSQVGCAMGCGFCETAQMGLIRSLSAREIVAQWWAARHIEKITINNIVFMGMGEPLDNLGEVLGAIAVLTDHHGAAIPMRAITISTVGRVDGLRELVRVVQRPGWKRLGIALSLNAPSDEVRDGIMPVNRRWGMDELREAMLELVRVRGSRKILFEYVLIPGVNDAPEHAERVAHWLEPFMRTSERGHIGLLNVIPYNPRRDSPWDPPDESDVERFVDRLARLGVFVKRRRTKGRTTMAACGQLGNERIRARRPVELTSSVPGGARG